MFGVGAILVEGYESLRICLRGLWWDANICCHYYKIHCGINCPSSFCVVTDCRVDQSASRVVAATGEVFVSLALSRNMSVGVGEIYGLGGIRSSGRAHSGGRFFRCIVICREIVRGRRRRWEFSLAAFRLMSRCPSCASMCLSLIR